MRCSRGDAKLLKFARAAIFTPDMTNSGAVLPRACGREFDSLSVTVEFFDLQNFSLGALSYDREVFQGHSTAVHSRLQ